PAWDFARLEKNVGAFEYLVQVHYRYYKFYANMVVALAWAFAAGGYAQGWRGLVYWLLAGLFLIASRDALRKYYERAGQLLRPGADAAVAAGYRFPSPPGMSSAIGTSRAPPSRSMFRSEMFRFPRSTLLT